MAKAKVKVAEDTIVAHENAEPVMPKVEIEPTVKTVKVFARRPPFVDLIKDIPIGADPVEVELHPWLHLNINEGILVVVE